MDARASGDRLFIMFSVALSMSGSLNIAEGSMPPGGAPGPPMPPPFILALMFIICSRSSGFRFFIMLDICSARSGLEAICSAAWRIMSASSGLLMFIFLRSSSPIDCVIWTAALIMSGFWKIWLMAAGSPPPGKPPGKPPGPAVRWASSCFRSCSGMLLRLSIADRSISGFFWRASICCFIMEASMPGGRGAFAIICSICSGESFDIASEASFSMSGFAAILSAACAQCPGSPDAADVGRLLLLVARLPPEVESPVVHAGETSCCLGREVSSVTPVSFRISRRRASSVAMALSEGESSEASRTSATACCTSPISARAWPRRKRALKLLGSIFRARSVTSTALSYFLDLR
mmetsp:Transcript_57770/g.151935  ORF Transcript_57770/g.151935 Transcript_57770/m.151935 type:complete len:349 (+) Transcript_57770:390-1436(+)